MSGGANSPPQLRRGKPSRSDGWGGAGQTIQSLDQHHPGALIRRGFAALQRHPSSAKEGSFFSVLLGFILAFFLLGLTPAVRANPRLFWSFIGAGAVLVLWAVTLFITARRQGRILTFEFAPKPQHYLQAFLQTAIYAYWGWYWRQVYDAFYLIIAQLLFAYAFDLLLAWSRRDRYTLGFLPFPIVFSTNLFLWFKPDWFYFQFIMVALGFAAKELIHWTKEGRDTHIFNPSSFSLMVFSLGLILTGTTGNTWGKENPITQF